MRRSALFAGNRHQLGMRHNVRGDDCFSARHGVGIAVAIDGVGLDRACRRLKQRVEWSKLLSSLSIGKTITFARYYNVLPPFDDARQVSFIDALTRAGFSSVIKRLPPRGVDIFTGIDIEIATDLMGYAMDTKRFPDIHTDKVKTFSPDFMGSSDKPEEALQETNKLKSIILVCPSRELDYPVAFLNSLGINTATADFGSFNSKRILNTSNNWIDLSDSNQIWA